MWKKHIKHVEKNIQNMWKTYIYKTCQKKTHTKHIKNMGKKEAYTKTNIKNHGGGSATTPADI